MASWRGWSTDQQQVDRTRILKKLFDGFRSDPDGWQTMTSTDAAIGELGLSLNGSALAYFFAHDQKLFDETNLTMNAGNDSMLLTTKGRSLADDFDNATSNRRYRARSAREAILRWLDDRNGTGSSQPLEPMLKDPHSWFWGTQFTIEELDAAAGNLAARHLVTAFPANGRKAVRVGLTEQGDICLEKFDGDPDRMESSMTGQQPTVRIDTYNQSGGASAIASQNFTQNVSQVGQTAAEFAKLLKVLRESGEVPDDLVEEVEDAETELEEASDDPSAAIAVRKGNSLLARIASSPLAKPVISAMAPFISRLVAHWLNLPPSS